MKHALIWAPYAPQTPGAAGTRVHYQKAALEEKGWKVHILTPREGKTKLIQTALRVKPQLVLGVSPPLTPNLDAWLVSRVVGARLILDAKEDGRALAAFHHTQKGWKDALYLRLRAFLYTHADALWFLTPADEEEAKKHYSLTQPCTQVPNGTDARLHFSTNARTQIRKEWNVTKERVLLYAGTMGDEDLDGLLEHGLRALPTNVHTIWALACDSTPADQARLHSFKEKLSQSGLKHHVYVNIPPARMQEVLSGADAGLLPWRSELPTSLPVKVFDYAGSGIRTFAKSGKDSTLEKFLESHSELGKSVRSWDAFAVALNAWCKKPLTPTAQREKRARATHVLFDRMKPVRAALETI